ncbi:MAG: hypothetical protein RSD40_03705 [Bacilli bacterium]
MNFEQYLSLSYKSDLIKEILDSFEKEKVSSFILNPRYNKSFISEIPLLGKHKFIDNAYYYDNTYKLGNSYLFKNGVLYIQDASAMMPVEFLKIEKGDSVLDMCAAPGGKSIDTLLKLDGTGFLLSNEIDYERSKILSSNIEKFGFPNVVVSNNDFSEVYKNFKKSFDKIIIDVPCSGSFMFRKNEEAFKLWSTNKIVRLLPIQKNLLEMASYMLKDGGLISYSTCSLSPEENELQINNFLAEHDDFSPILTMEDESFYHPDLLKESTYLFPHKFKGEGQFIAILKKNGKSEKSPYVLDNNYRSILANKYDITFHSRVRKLDNVYGYFTTVKTNSLKVLRYGVHIALVKGKIETPTFALAHMNFPFERVINLTEAEKNRYFWGLGITTEVENAYYQIKYHNVPITFAKSVEKLLKNTYPKGLRNK